MNEMIIFEIVIFVVEEKEHNGFENLCSLMSCVARIP